MEVTRESRRLVRVRVSEQPMQWCAACAAEVRWVSLREAAAVSGVTEREIQQRVSAGSLHAVEESNAALICLPSLTRSIG